jgi:hypothetical protein
MKKVLLVVALLLLATPLFAADVTVTATKVGSPVGNLQQVDIGWSGAADACSIRAFALSLTTDTNAVISNIRNFKRGESKTGNLGYGIFPARFRQYITPLNGTDVNSTGGYGWADGNYNPLAVWGDVNCGWGENTAWIVTELGTLYTGDSNAPGTSGTLFTIDVNSNNLPSAADCNLCIALDQIRGGVVKKDTTAATVTLPPGGSGAPAGCIRVQYIHCTTPANEVGVARATAEAAWLAQNFTLSGVGVVDCAHVGLIISQDTACVTTPTAIHYTYGIAQVEPNVIGMTRAAAVTALNAAGYTVSPLDVNGPPTATITAVGSVTGQTPGPLTSCGSTTVTLNVVVYPVKVAAPNSMYANWVTSGKPQCWAYARQCRGDADGKAAVGVWVSNNDLNILRPALTKAVSAIPPGGRCADFDHKAAVGVWVSNNDLNILRAYLTKPAASVPMCGSAGPADANYWYYCVPTGGTCPGGVCAPAGICPNTP